MATGVAWSREGGGREKKNQIDNVVRDRASARTLAVWLEDVSGHSFTSVGSYIQLNRPLLPVVCHRYRYSHATEKRKKRGEKERGAGSHGGFIGSADEWNTLSTDLGEMPSHVHTTPQTTAPDPPGCNTISDIQKRKRKGVGGVGEGFARDLLPITGPGLREVLVGAPQASIFPNNRSNARGSEYKAGGVRFHQARVTTERDYILYTEGPERERKTERFWCL